MAKRNRNKPSLVFRPEIPVSAPPRRRSVNSTSKATSILSASQTQILQIYLGTVVVSSLLGGLFAFPNSILNDKLSPLNVYFVKLGWAWTSIPLSLFAIYSGLALSPLNLQKTISSLTRIAVTSIYWGILTQWFFGHSLFDLIYLFSGDCKGNASVLPKLCLRNGGAWTGFDVSGHCFLLILGSFVILEEMKALVTTNVDGNNTQKDSDESSDPILGQINKSPVESVFLVFFVFLLSLWWLMLVVTCLYYHSWSEKLSGTFFATVFWILTYSLMGVFQRQGPWHITSIK